MVINQTTQTKIYSPHEVDIEDIINSANRIPHKPGNPCNKDRKTYLDLVCAFDIETTYLPDLDQSIMYVWQLCISHTVIMGRTWEEYTDLLKRIAACLKDKERLVFWVHNLSFEFQFLRGIYPFTAKEVFCMDRRKICKCEMYNSVEYRCSYIHSNMSLDQYTKKMHCKTQKLTGSFDYNVLRYPWTELTDLETAYCINDVVSLCEAITTEMQLDGDNLDTIPLTSTGYVRRKCKEAMRSKPGFRSYISEQLPDYELYVALREAFRGGNTHGNRLIVGHILDNGKSIDRSSSYPDVLVNHQYPVTGFVHRGPCTMERFIKQKDVHHRACLIRIAVFNIRLKNPHEGCPYLSKDKCRLIRGAYFDNGRILCAQYLEMTLTDIDYNIIEAMYSWENPCIFDSWFTRYGKLPSQFVGVINDMYKKKTALKGDPENKILYDKTKAMINALYGMTAQNPLRLNFDFCDNDYHLKDIDPVTELLKYNRRAFLVYQWGVWVTAWARWELQRVIDIAGDGVLNGGKSMFVYCDTDSVKYVGDIDITAYNTEQERISRENGGYAVDRNGDPHYMGVYEDDGYYNRFVTWGAKRYAYEKDGQVYVVTAGVTRRGNGSENLGGEELARAGGLEAYKPGMVFREAGGSEARYADNVDMHVMIDGHDVHITDNVSIRPSEYTLGITGEYEALLNNIELMWDLWEEYKRESTLDKYHA